MNSHPFRTEFNVLKRKGSEVESFSVELLKNNACVNPIELFLKRKQLNVVPCTAQRICVSERNSLVATALFVLYVLLLPTSIKRKREKRNLMLFFGMFLALSHFTEGPEHERYQKINIIPYTAEEKKN
jgi:hypothetical protein